MALAPFIETALNDLIIYNDRIIMLSGLDNFLSTDPIFGARNFDRTPDLAQKQSTCPIGKQLETLIFAFYYLIRTSSFHF